jgi:hypothetical protein
MTRYGHLAYRQQTKVVKGGAVKPLPEARVAMVFECILDFHSRKVVGWAMERYLRTELVVDALRMAVWRKPVPDLVDDSDQGVQYTSLFLRKAQGGGHYPVDGKDQHRPG